MEEHQFSFTITISVSYYVTTETRHNEDNSITVDYYGNVMYSLAADGVELCNSTVFPHTFEYCKRMNSSDAEYH